MTARLATPSWRAPGTEQARPLRILQLNHRAVRWFILCALLVACAAYRLDAMGASAAPPGSDGGNWLAFGRELMGEDVKAARAVYPPIVPALSVALAAIAGPLQGAKLMASISGVLSGISFYVLASQGAPWGLAMLATAAFLASGYRSEVVAFGGYPQMMAEAMALGALSLFLGATEHRPRTIAGAAVLTALVIGTHHLTSIFLFASLALCAVVLVAHRNRGRSVVRALLWFSAGAVVLSAPFLPTYYSLLRELDGSPFNAQGWAIATAGETFAYVFRNTIGLWYMLLGVAIVSVALPSGERYAPMRTATVSLMLPALALFVGTGEVRFLQFLLPGIILGVVLTAAVLWRNAGSALSRLALVVMMACAAGGVAWGGVRYTHQAFPWYQVMDDPRIAALSWLRSHTPPSAVIAATPTRNGWPLGWWIEGYAGRKTFSGGNPAWMVFLEEKEQTQTANRVFDLLKASDPDAWAIAASAGISYLVVDRATWRSPRVPAGFDTVFANEAILIIEVRVSSQREPGPAGERSARI